MAIIAISGCGEPTGGLSPNYQPQNFDPKLTPRAESLVPVICALDAYIRTTGLVPQSLDQLPSLPGMTAYLYYSAEPNHYRLGIKLGWDPSLWYRSQDGRWTFDPGDGQPEKVITLDVAIEAR